MYHDIYLLLNYWIFGLFLVFFVFFLIIIMGKKCRCENSCGRKSLCGHMFLFLLGKYPELQLLGIDMISICLTLEDTAKLSSARNV